MLGFELACVAIVAVTLALMSRVRPWRELGLDYATLAASAFVGEETSILFYRFYRYAPGWHGRLVDVPVLVPLIWPLVVLSGRDVAHVVLGPSASRLRVALLTGALVAFDASLVEVVAVRAGLWSWAEPGHLGVPVIGVLGWGLFAFGATWPAGRAEQLAVSFPSTHALILASWWAVFRWTARGELGAFGFVLLALCALGFALAALRTRRAGRSMEPSVWLPRVLAAGLFFALLLVTAPRDASLWLHVALVALPYLLLTSLRASRSAGVQRGATPPSP